MSAELDDLLIEQARRLQAFSVLPKPVTFQQLTGAVCRALERVYNWRASTAEDAERRRGAGRN